MLDDEEEAYVVNEEEGMAHHIEGPALAAEAEVYKATDESRQVLYSKYTKAVYAQALESFLTDDEVLQFESLKFLFKAIHGDLTEELRKTSKAITVYMCGPSQASCKCECSTGGPCDHKWDGPWEELESGGTTTCSKCHMTAMSHSLWVAT